MAQQTFINGKRYGFTSVSMSMDGVDITKGTLLAISYGFEATRGIVNGNSAVMTGRTRGYGQVPVSFTMLLSEWEDLMQTVTSNGFYAITDREIDFSVSFAENYGADVTTHEIRGFGIDKGDINTQTGQEAVTVVCSGVAARMSIKGMEAFADPAL